MSADRSGSSRRVCTRHAGLVRMDAGARHTSSHDTSPIALFPVVPRRQDHRRHRGGRVRQPAADRPQDQERRGWPRARQTRRVASALALTPPVLPHLPAFRRYRYRDSNRVARPVTTAFIWIPGVFHPLVAGGGGLNPVTLPPKYPQLCPHSRDQIRAASRPSVFLRVSPCESNTTAWGTIRR